MYGAAGAIKAAHKKLPVPETVEQLLMEKGRKLHKTLDEPTISKPQPVFKSARGKCTTSPVAWVSETSKICFPGIDSNNWDSQVG